MKTSEFELWLNDGRTREIMELVGEEVKTYESALVDGMYARETTMEMVAGKYIDASAYIRGLKFILNDIVNHLEEDRA